MVVNPHETSIQETDPSRSDARSFGTVARIVTVVTAIFGGGVLGQGCGCDNGEPYEDQNGDLQCGECRMYAYNCVSGNAVCAANAADALHMGCEGSSETIDCRQNEGDTGSPNGCSSWSPGSNIGYNSQGVYEIDQDLVDEITLDPSPILGCDGAYYIPQSGGYYALDFIENTDLAYHLGFQDGDIVIAVNGKDLQWPQDYLDALVTLKDETEFQVKIVRSSNTVYLSYEFVQ